MIQSTYGNDSIYVSPSGLEYQHSQCPVADATGNDVPPSGLIANSTTTSVASTEEEKRVTTAVCLR